VVPQAARTPSQEYWRPANPATARIARPILADALCIGCGSEYPALARFCHMCGNERNPCVASTPRALTFADLFDVSLLRRRFSLSVPCLLFFIAGISCLIVTFGIGLVYKADSLVEWQAMQLWRLEWLSGGLAAMLAGLILKVKANV
jgi:hypothetical protein